MSKELLNIVEVVANEKEVEREVIFTALEAALAAATRKRFLDEEVEIEVKINPKTGEYETFRVFKVVDDDDFIENPAVELRETVANYDFPDENLKAGDIYKQPIENEPFGRISAQMAKQIIIQKLREAEREKVYQQFIELEGSLVRGVVSRYEKGNVIVELDQGGEATIQRQDMINRETLRKDDRILAYLKKVNKELRGPQLQLTRSAPEFLIALFKKEVPEINSGNIEIMGAARDPGIRAKIAVRSADPHIDAVGSCVGIRGSRVQGVMNEMAGENIDIVLWDEDPEIYVQKAMSPAVITNSAVDYETKTIDVAVPKDKLPQAVGRGGQNVRLASELTKWTINVLSEEEFNEKEQAKAHAAEENLAQILNISRDEAIKLFNAEFKSAEDVAYADAADLEELGFSETEIENMQEAAGIYLLGEALGVDKTAEDEDEMKTELSDIEWLEEDLADKLQEAGILKQEDLAELSVDELIKISGLDQDSASQLILKAREPWFR